MEKFLYVLDRVFTSNLFWLAAIAILVILTLHFWGFFSAMKRIIWDCLIDKSSNLVTIINFARFSMILVAIWKLTIGNPTITITPEVVFTPHPEENWEIIALIFGFIGGTQWIFNKYQFPLTKEPKHEEPLTQETINEQVTNPGAEAQPSRRVQYPPI